MTRDTDLLTAEEAWDLAQRLYGAWNEGGAEAVASGFWDPEIVFSDDPSFPDAQVMRGRDAVVMRLDAFMEGLGDFKFTVLEALPFPGGALAGVRIDSTGPSSGIPIQTVVYHVGRLRSGRFVEVRTFRQRDEALAAAGLTSDARPPDPTAAP